MTLPFLYHTRAGRKVLKVLTKPEISQACGRFMDSKFSRVLIPTFIKQNQIKMARYERKRYESFNEFFCRQLRSEYRKIDVRKESFIAPCDGLLSAYSIDNDLVIPVKNSRYHISDLLRDRELAQKYNGGTCLVFRLCVNHYHRYCYPDYGMKGENVFLPGILHTVQPIALREGPVFTENAREYTVLHTANFGDMVQMEVGAMLVGKIDNYHGVCSFEKGEEKGKFLYGGSTIILLVEPGRVKFPTKLFEATERDEEVPVRIGMKIGEAC